MNGLPYIGPKEKEDIQHGEIIIAIP